MSNLRQHPEKRVNEFKKPLTQPLIGGWFSRPEIVNYIFRFSFRSSVGKLDCRHPDTKLSFQLSSEFDVNVDNKCNIRSPDFDWIWRFLHRRRWRRLASWIWSRSHRWHQCRVRIQWKWRHVDCYWRQSSMGTIHLKRGGARERVFGQHICYLWRRSRGNNYRNIRDSVTVIGAILLLIWYW